MISAAFAWLNDLIQWFGRWIPRLILIQTTHRGVKFGPRGEAVAVGPGLVVWWPITHEIVLVPVTTQSIQLCTQILRLNDDNAVVPRVVLCTLNVLFKVNDVVAAATRVLNMQAMVTNQAQTMTVRYWPGSFPDTDIWLRQAESALRGEMAGYGVDVLSLEPAGLGVGAALKNVADWQHSDNANGTRPV